MSPTVPYIGSTLRPKYSLFRYIGPEGGVLGFKVEPMGFRDEGLGFKVWVFQGFGVTLAGDWLSGF